MRKPMLVGQDVPTSVRSAAIRGRQSSCLVRAALVIFAFTALTTAVRADPILVDISFLGSGTVGTTAFTDKTVSLIATGDTTAVTGSAITFFDLQPATLSVGVIGIGTGTYAVDSGTYLFSNELVGAAGFGQSPNGDYVDFFDPSFSSWNLQTSFGPTAGLDPVLVNGDVFGTAGLPTSIGLIKVTSEVDGSGSVFATVRTAGAPEPRTVSVLAILMLGMFWIVGRRRHLGSSSI